MLQSRRVKLTSPSDATHVENVMRQGEWSKSGVKRKESSLQFFLNKKNPTHVFSGSNVRKAAMNA